MLAIKERLRCVKQTCSRTIQTSGADCFVRGAHHRRCAREGLTGAYDASCTGQVASSLGQQWHRFEITPVHEFEITVVHQFENMPKALANPSPIELRRRRWLTQGCGCRSNPGPGLANAFGVNPTTTLSIDSRQIEAVEVHDLVPSRDEVVHELLLRIRTCIHFGKCPKL